MLQVTTNPTPGLSAAADRAVAAGDLRTTSYRRWVERAQLASSVLGRQHTRRRAAVRRGVLEAARIGVPSAASGTLSRLP